LRNWKVLTGAGILITGFALASTATFAFDPPADDDDAAEATPAGVGTNEGADDGSEMAAMTMEDGVYTAEQAEAGWDPYFAECAQCHGNTLRGTPGGPRIVGSSFQRKWEGTTVAEFYEWMSGNMPAGRGGQLGTPVYADLTALIFQENGFPPGEEAFNPEDEKWAEVIFVPAAE